MVARQQRVGDRQCRRKDGALWQQWLALRLLGLHVLKERAMSFERAYAAAQRITLLQRHESGAGLAQPLGVFSRRGGLAELACDRSACDGEEYLLCVDIHRINRVRERRVRQAALS